MKLPAEERKQIENEMFFRKANERVGAGIDDLNAMCDEVGAPSFRWDDKMLMLVTCECSDEDCDSRISMRWSVYQAIHDNRNKFIVTTGHQVTNIETVVSHEDGYNVVLKNNSTPKPVGEHTLNETTVDNS